MTRLRRAIVALASTATVSASVYALVVRPRISSWGATDEEVHKVLPGDELGSPLGRRPVSTRAITIDAAPEDVWPWLVQMGSVQVAARQCPHLDRDPATGVGPGRRVFLRYRVATWTLTGW